RGHGAGEERALDLPAQLHGARATARNVVPAAVAPRLLHCRAVSRFARIAIVLAAVGCGGDPGSTELGASRSGPGKADDDDDGAPRNFVSLAIHDRGVDPYSRVNVPLSFSGGLQLELVFSAYEPLAVACQIPLPTRRSPLWAGIPLERAQPDRPAAAAQRAA